MAWSNVEGIACPTKADAFMNIRDCICSLNGTNNDYTLTGLGWTLYDSSYAVDADNVEQDDYVVFYSVGKDGNDPQYIQFMWTSTTRMRVIRWTFWEVGVGGTRYMANADNIYYSDSLVNGSLDIRGNLSDVIISNTVADGSYTYCVFWGQFVDSGYNTDIAIPTGAITAGSDVSITVDTVPSSWAVDEWIVVRGNDSNAKVEWAQIKTLVGNTVTLDLDNSYPADTRMQTYWTAYCTSSTNGNAASDALTRATATAPVIIACAISANTANINAADPDIPSGLRGMAAATWYENNGPHGLTYGLRMIQSTGLVASDTFTDINDESTWTYFKSAGSSHYVIRTSEGV